MKASEYGLLAVGWTAWVVPFFRVHGASGPPERRDCRARWGIAIQALAFSVLWQNMFWLRTPGPARVTASAGFFVLASLLFWTATNALGTQWRFDAGLDADHQLVRAGAYRFVRHPIYTSMGCMLLGTGSLITPLPLLVLAAACFLLGTEIRVRVEDELLRSRFGSAFDEYRRSVSAYIPFTR